MSLFGGTAVFAVLGFMANQLDAKIQTVVQSGTGLAFIAYPEVSKKNIKIKIVKNISFSET
jgi:solute carrier family 6 amino acid transporter-like protein 5/7/9/14